MPSMMPMGGSSFRSPNDISGLDGWWEADAITGLAEAANVALWPFSNTAGSNLTASINYPTFRANVRNGLPIVRFTNVPSTQLYSTIPSDRANVTYAACLTQGVNGGGVFSSSANGINSGVNIILTSAGLMRMILGNVGPIIATATTAATPGAWNVIVATYASDGTYAFYVNGTLSNTGVNLQFPIYGETRRVGSYSAGASANLDADMGGLLLANRVLDIQDITSLTRWWGSKYMIPRPFTTTEAGAL